MTDVDSTLRAVAAELTEAGAMPGTDFVVRGVVPLAGSSEYYGLRVLDDGRYEVWYSDMGDRRTLLVTAEASNARATFVDLVIRIAQQRGAKPLLPYPRVTRNSRDAGR